MKIRYLAAAVSACLAWPAHAEDPSLGGVAVYATQSEIDFGSGFAPDGTGVGFRGFMSVWEGIFATAEYQFVTVEQGNAEADIDNLRIGGGYAVPIIDIVSAFARLEYVSLDLEGVKTQDGPAVHIGSEVRVLQPLTLFLTVGFLTLTDIDGPELDFGAHFAITPAFGAFLDYRLFMAESDTGSETDFSDIRLGGTFRF